MSFVVAIDGPAGTGKGTVTKIVSEKLNLIYIDTGAMYRAVTVKALNNSIQPEEIDKIEEILRDISIIIKRKDDKQQILLDGEDVTEKIRTPEVDNLVSRYAAIKQVREKMTALQREMKREGNIIMEGRDIGTVVFPDADVKIYLDATIEERAKRRYKQNIEKGINCNYEEVLQSLKERHILETTRKIAPLKQAEDAVYLDSTNLSIEEVVKKIIEIIKMGVSK
ncbi:MAG: (d)CMP kinase [Clostridia bacterium]|nr:(d)CMP kinase [Clostridia bacterium]